MSKSEQTGGGGVLAPQGTEAEAKAALVKAYAAPYRNGLH